MPEGSQFGNGEIPCAGKYAVEQGRHVSCREDEHILALAAAAPAFGCVFHYVQIQGCNEVGAAHRAAGMSAPGLCDHSEYVPADLGRCVGQLLYVSHISLCLSR